MSGFCAAGFYCGPGSTSPVPDTQCSPGYYCPIGAVKMLPCPAGFFRPTSGGIQKTDCQACQPGYLCTTGSEPEECPRGYYCSVMSTTATPCPRGTYSSQTRLTTATSCTDCPPGYFCNETAISNHKLYPCPMGQYCPSRTLSPANCPAGTFKNITGARQAADCGACPPGYYCPEGTI